MRTPLLVVPDDGVHEGIFNPELWSGDVHGSTPEPPGSDRWLAQVRDRRAARVRLDCPSGLDPGDVCVYMSAPRTERRRPTVLEVPVHDGVVAEGLPESTSRVPSFRRLCSPRLGPG